MLAWAGNVSVFLCCYVLFFFFFLKYIPIFALLVRENIAIAYTFAHSVARLQIGVVFVRGKRSDVE